MCSAVSVFIETNDLIKFQFRSKPPRAKAARFSFLYFRNPPAILEIGESSSEFLADFGRT